MTGAARRLVTTATALMPPGRRDWGRAIAAELDQARSLGVAGAVFAPIGAALGRELAIAWSRARGLGG